METWDLPQTGKWSNLIFQLKFEFQPNMGLLLLRRLMLLADKRVTGCTEIYINEVVIL